MNIKKIIPNFDELKRTNFPGSMDPSEIFSFIYLLKKKKINLVIESGRQYGYSTFYISKYCKKNNIEFLSIDDETQKKPNIISRKILKKNSVKYFIGNFYNIIYAILSNINKNKKTALLIDGPKGLQTYVFCFGLFLKFKNINFIFFDNILSPPQNRFTKLIFKNFFVYNDLKLPLSVEYILKKYNKKYKIKNYMVNDFGYCNFKNYKDDIFSVFLINLLNLYFFCRREIVKFLISFKN